MWKENELDWACSTHRRDDKFKIVVGGGDGEVLEWMWLVVKLRHRL